MTLLLNNACAGLAVAAKCLHQAGLLEQSMKSSLDTLAKLGEQPLRDMSDDTLKADMMKMNKILQNTPDDSILNLHESKAKKIITTLKIYSNLCHVLYFAKPSLIVAVSLRMVELTMNNGLTFSSPLAFGYYGQSLVANGSVKEGCRLGRYHRMRYQFFDHRNDMAQSSHRFLFNTLVYRKTSAETC